MAASEDVAAPAESNDEASPGLAARPRPTRLNAICVIAMVLGVLGVIDGVIALGSAALEPLVGTWESTTIGDGGDDELMKMFNQASENIAEATGRYQAVSLASSGASMLLAVALLFSGWATRRGSERGRLALLLTLAACVVYQLLHAGFYGLLSWESFQAARRLDGSAFGAAASGPADPAIDQVVGIVVAMVFVILTVEILSFAFFLVLKLVYYLLSIRYLRRPDVRAFFEHSH